MIKASSILLILLPVFVCQANNVWTPVGVGLSIRHLVDVASVPGGFVAVGSETLLYGSKNTWTKVNAPVAADFVAVAFLGGTGVAVASTGEIVSSGDGGKTWQLSSFNTQSATLYDVKARAADGFWIAASNGKIFRISPDLSAFSADTLGPLTVFSKIVVTPQAVWALTANGERFVRRSNGSWADSGNVLGLLCELKSQ